MPVGICRRPSRRATVAGMTTLPITRTTVSRWLERTAQAVPLLVLPSGLWRIALGLGVPVGFTGELAEVFAAPGWITAYVVVLSLLAEGAALLALGLVRPWGEVVPRWVPRIGGRVVPVAAAVVPAALGVVVLAVGSVITVATWYGPQNMGDPDAPQGLAGAVMTACYAPQLLWAPLLAVLTWAYFRRRTRAS